MSDEVDFLHGHKHESVLQINTMIFDGNGQLFKLVNGQWSSSKK